ncbi:TPA: hypothetical protein DIC20_02905 [Candidatus Dependentiae bacterium]|nr:MAG: hypothetical protein US03_C0009G0036 [candidate division TM6 bacterium GW2011_GWF2_36_131]KKQ02875.1 MAG: hypothetical protein US13_C0009G0067 [candidate division TM6 bacterium GW2011_GWE2_36_25]KKQ19527.1 MAG: hypothetical protein US32_C0008G0028 [candidate division TM6 bacterium GW2011_GWA2_36_9]HBR70240.1 hypothetical protein [Candidatus Dependentiae bacterium]HCU00624.1 hypothetical protein [Candidatus Dependentiae bacterium]
MIVVIDGYNLIKQVLGTKRVSQRQRDEFIMQLGGYFRKRKLQGIIVFDGGESNYPFQEKKGGLTIIYSGYKETADEVIAQYLQEHREYQILVVSSDRAVRHYAETLGKQTMKAPEFYYTYLEKKPQPVGLSGDQTLFKLSADSSVELDNLMMEASKDLEIKKDDFSEKGIPRHKPAQKLSKQERKRKKLIDRLD